MPRAPRVAAATSEAEAEEQVAAAVFQPRVAPAPRARGAVREVALDYAYVFRDLVRIGVLGAALIGSMIILSIVMPD